MKCKSNCMTQLFFESMLTCHSHKLNKSLIHCVDGGPEGLSHVYTKIIHVTHKRGKQPQNMMHSHPVGAGGRLGCSFMSPHSGQGMGRLRGNKRAGKRERGESAKVVAG